MKQSTILVLAALFFHPQSSSPLSSTSILDYFFSSELSLVEGKDFIIWLGPKFYAGTIVRYLGYAGWQD
jgi:hypothetical protein